MRARVIDPGGWAHEGTHSHGNLQLRQRRRTARNTARFLREADKVNGVVSVPVEATEEMEEVLVNFHDDTRLAYEGLLAASPLRKEKP